MTEKQVSSRAIGNIIPFVRRAESFDNNMDGPFGGTENRTAAFFTDTTAGRLMEGVRGHLAVRQEKIESMRRQLRSNHCEVSAAQTAKSLLKDQIMSELIASRKLTTSKTS